MKRLLIYSVIMALSFSIYGCGGGAGGAAGPPGENPGVASIVQLIPAQYIAQTNSFVTLNAKVLDGNGVPMANTQVFFTNLSAPFGVLTAASANTNSLGLATVRLSSTAPGFATIVAQVNTGAGNVRDQKTVFFTSQNVLRVRLQLDVNAIPENGAFNEPGDFIVFETSPGDDEVALYATVRNAGGVPLAGAGVTWSADQAEVKFTYRENITGTNGFAKAIVKIEPRTIRDTDTHANVFAYADNGAANMVTLFLRPVAISTAASSLTAFPDTVNVNGAASVTARVRLTTGGPVADGTTVNFSTTCGSVTPFSQTSNGIASASFTAPPAVPTGGKCTVSGTVGGRSIGSAEIAITTALSVQPSTLTINGTRGGTATFTIFGGFPGYAVSTDQAAFAPNPATVPLRGGTFSVTVPAGTTPRTVTYTVRDAAGATVTVTLKIEGIAALSVQPGQQTISGAAGGTATFTILGGEPGYFVFSSNAAFAPVPTTVDASGGTFAVTVPAGSPSGEITYTVVDAKGATSTAKLTITAPELVILPSAQTINGAPGGTATFTIYGGGPGYTVATSNPAFPATPGAVAASGGSFSVVVPPNTPATTVTYTVMDSLGTQKTATLTIIFENIDFYMLPADATIPVGGSIAFQIYGGALPFDIIPNSPAIDLSYDDLIDPRSFTVVGVSTGEVTITVRDANSRQIKATVKVQ